MYNQYTATKLIDGQNYLYFPPATVFKAENLIQDKNISFIGSNFYPPSIPKQEEFYTDSAIKLYDALKNNYYFSVEQSKESYLAYPNLTELCETIRAYYVGQDRLKHMQMLCDLGFTFYGIKYWNKIAYYDFELAKAFDSTPKITMEENQWVYNTSKISVNISHPQAKSSFSWRVMDIMATNACLLMEDKPDWRDLFEKYLSKETLNSVIYKDRFDMREKAVKLLNDNALRARCVKDLNNAIEQNGRWEKRFKLLEDFTNVKLLNINNQNKTYIFIKREDESNNNAVTQKRYTSFTKRIKIIAYLFLLLLAQIPIIDIVLNTRKRNKLYKKLKKYWR